MATLDANGLTIAYEAEGAGPPLVLLHGASTSGHDAFAAQRPALATAFRLLIPDARGHGRTRWDVAAGFGYADLVDDLGAFADGLGLRTFHLLGHSMGAMTALQAAVRWPERIRTLVVGGISIERQPRAAAARRLFDPDRIDAIDPAWAADLARRHDPVQGDGAWRRLLPAIAADVAHQPLLAPADLRRVDAPTLVIVGDRDPFAPVEHARELARHLPAGRLLVVPDCGHETYSTWPAVVNEALHAFYRSTEAVATARAGPASGGLDR